MAKFLSGRQRNLNLGITSFTESKTVLQTKGNVGIGTTNAQQDALYVVGSTNITGNINIGGGTTISGFVDVDNGIDVAGHTELDSLRVSGVSTFQDDVYLGNDDRIYFGGSNDLQIYNDGLNSYIVDAGVGNLYVRGTASINFENAVGIETYAKFNVDGATELWYDNVKKFETTGAGVSITGGIEATGVSTFSGNVNLNADLDVDGHTELDDVNISGIVTATSFVGPLVGSVTGDLTGVASTATKLETARDFSVSGDATAPAVSFDGTGNVDLSLTLANSGVTTGIYGSQTAIPIITVDAKGRITSATTTTVGTALTVSGDSGSEVIDLLSETLSITGGANVTTSAASNGVEVALDDNISLVNVNATGVITATSFHTGSEGSSIRITSDTISGPATLNIDPAGIGDNTGSVRIKGDLYVDGEEFIVDSSRIELADFNVGIASTVSTNNLLDGAGIGIGDTSIRKTLTYNQSSDSLKSSENFDIADGKVYKVNGTEVLSEIQLTIPNLYSSGIGTIETLDTTTGTIDYLTGTNVSYSGIGTIETLDTTTGTIDYLTGTNVSYSGIGTIETLDTTTGTIDYLTGTNLSYSGISTLGSVVVGGATTELVVNGDTRITGILTVGSSSVTIDGTNNEITVGTGVTIYGDSIGIGTITITESSISVLDDLTGSTASFAGGVNVSGVLTATRFDGDLNALGKTYYVATTGSDSNSGNNINEPYLTIAQALSVATNGDVINVSAGVYEETCPLTVPRGVTVKGAGLRATSIRPTTATQQENVFLLNDISTLEDFSIRGSYFDSTADTGYAFSYATGIAITTRSPYIQRVTVLNTGSTVTADDPYGYDTADSPPTSYIAGAGAKVDGSLVASNSLEAGMLFNEVTFFTPNNKGIVLTNGARAEYLNCFHYFASQAIVGLAGTVGIAGTADARLKFTNPSVTPSVNDVVKLREGGTVVAVGTITEYNDPYAKIDGLGFGKFVVAGAGTTQDLNFYQSDGTTHTGIASAIALADYTMFGAEMRSVGCAVEYGSQGVVADGNGVKLRLFATNFNHVGSGKDMTNDSTLTVQANEVIELNDGQVSYVSIDQSGDFRVGDAFVVSQETGNVSFAATTYNLETTGELTVTDGGSNQSVITPTSLTVGNIQIAANTLSSTSGDINIDPAGSNETNVSGNLNVTGIITATGDINTSTDVKINGVSVLTSASDEAIALAIALG